MSIALHYFFCVKIKKYAEIEQTGGSISNKILWRFLDFHRADPAQFLLNSELRVRNRSYAIFFVRKTAKYLKIDIYSCILSDDY